jgi:hypothetical protein
VLQRPGVAMIGNTIVAGFGGHCDNFNYTGMLVAVSKTPGTGVTNIQATEASPGMRGAVLPTIPFLIIFRCPLASDSGHYHSRRRKGWYLAIRYGYCC